MNETVGQVPFRMHNGVQEEQAVATLTLKNVPEPLVERLKEEARQNRRSLNQEALHRLESSLARESRSGESAVDALRKLHARLGRVRPLTDAFLARARRDDRP